MNLRDYIGKLQKLRIELTNAPALQTRVTLVAALAVLGVFKRRIFVAGKDAQGAQIGAYSTEPLYINPNATSLRGVGKSGLKPSGKDGADKFKNGKKKKTAYLDKGYKELRDRTGRQSGFVDLNLSGASEQTVQVGRSGNRIALGFTNKAREKILKGNETRFKKRIFVLSKEDRDAFAQAAEREFRTILRAILRPV